MSYDDPIGAGPDPALRIITDSSRRAHPGAAGGTLPWRGNGENMAKARRARRRASFLSRLRHPFPLTSWPPACPLIQRCWPLFGFWRDRPPVTRQNMMIPPAEGDRS